MTPTVFFVIDTSYLLELFKVPGFSQDADVDEVRKRHLLAIENDNRLYVPLPCIFELGNHIADVKDGRFRRELGKTLFETVRSSLAKNMPWNITPSAGIEVLSQLCEVFAGKYVAERIGLTDTFTIQEAHRIKKKYSSFNCKVHIWTKDEALKAREPDSEKDPFLG